MKKTLCVIVGVSWCMPIKRTMEVSDHIKKMSLSENPIAYETMEGKIETCDKKDIIEVDLSGKKHIGATLYKFTN